MCVYVQEFYGKYLRPGSPSRRKLSVHILGREHRGELDSAAGTLPAGVQTFEDPQELKQGLQLYPAVVGTPLPSSVA